MPKHSRKGKKAWRKNVDVREEEDLGILREADDSRLFIVDKPSKQVELTRSQRKTLIAGRPLFEEKITTPIGKQKRTGIPRKTETNKYIQRLADNLEKQKKTKSKALKKPEPAPVKPFFDLWGSNTVDNDVNPTAAKRYRQSTSNLPESKLTSVDPGQSYRPRSTDHQLLLSKALDQVTNKLEPELKASQRLLPTARRGPDVEIKWNYSDSEGEDEEESEEEIDEEERRTREIAKHYSTKFTRTQRNKIKRKKMLLRRRDGGKKGGGDIDRLQSLLEGIEKQEEEHQKKLEARKQQKQYQSGMTKKVGKMKYEEKPIDFLYTDELPSSFRKLKPTNTLSMEIFNNFQRRNMVESRKPKPKRYKKVKYTETREAKRFNEVMGL